MRTNIMSGAGTLDHRMEIQSSGLPGELRSIYPTGKLSFDIFSRNSQTEDVVWTGGVPGTAVSDGSGPRLKRRKTVHFPPELDGESCTSGASSQFELRPAHFSAWDGSRSAIERLGVPRTEDSSDVSESEESGGQSLLLASVRQSTRGAPTLMDSHLDSLSSFLRPDSCSLPTTFLSESRHSNGDGCISSRRRRASRKDNSTISSHRPVEMLTESARPMLEPLPTASESISDSDSAADETDMPPEPTTSSGQGYVPATFSAATLSLGLHDPGTISSPFPLNNGNGPQFESTDLPSHKRHSPLQKSSLSLHVSSTTERGSQPLPPRYKRTALHKSYPESGLRASCSIPESSIRSIPTIQLLPTSKAFAIPYASINEASQLLSLTPTSVIPAPATPSNLDADSGPFHIAEGDVDADRDDTHEVMVDLDELCSPEEIEVWTERQWVGASDSDFAGSSQQLDSSKPSSNDSSDSACVPVSPTASSLLHLPPPPWSKLPSQPSFPAPSPEQSTRKRKHVTVDVARAGQKNDSSPTNSAVRDSDRHSPVITYRLKNGEGQAVYKEDFMANFLRRAERERESEIGRWKSRARDSDESEDEREEDEEVRSLSKVVGNGGGVPYDEGMIEDREESAVASEQLADLDYRQTHRTRGSARTVHGVPSDSVPLFPPSSSIDTNASSHPHHFFVPEPKPSDTLELAPHVSSASSSPQKSPKKRRINEEADRRRREREEKKAAAVREKEEKRAAREGQKAEKMRIKADKEQKRLESAQRANEHRKAMVDVKVAMRKEKEEKLMEEIKRKEAERQQRESEMRELMELRQLVFETGNQSMDEAEVRLRTRAVVDRSSFAPYHWASAGYSALSSVGVYSADVTWELKELGADINNIPELAMLSSKVQ